MNDSCRRIRLDAFISVYVEQYLKSRDPRSWRKELGRLRRIQEYFGEVWLDDLDAAAVEGFLADLRRGELMALRWQDVDLDAGCLIVRSEHSKTAEI